MEYTFLIILLISLFPPILIAALVSRSIARYGKSAMRKPLAEAMKRTLGGLVPKANEAAKPGDEGAPYTYEEGGMVKGAYDEGYGAESPHPDSTEGKGLTDFGSVYEAKTWGSLGGFENENVPQNRIPAKPTVNMGYADFRTTTMMPTRSSLERQGGRSEETSNIQTEKADKISPKPTPFALGDLSRAIVVREILGPPVSMRHRRS
jgi:hypothetical protein